MYAIIVTGGKQYRVQNGDILYVEKLDAAENETVTFDKVLAVSDDKGLTVGKPYVDVKVTGVVLKNGKSKKITVFTYKPKKSSARWAIGSPTPRFRSTPSATRPIRQRLPLRKRPRKRPNNDPGGLYPQRRPADRLLGHGALHGGRRG